MSHVTRPRRSAPQATTRLPSSTASWYRADPAAAGDGGRPGGVPRRRQQHRMGARPAGVARRGRWQRRTGGEAERGRGVSFPDLVPDLAARLPDLRGRLSANQPLADITWFRVGGPARRCSRPPTRATLPISSPTSRWTSPSPSSASAPTSWCATAASRASPSGSGAASPRPSWNRATASAPAPRCPMPSSRARRPTPASPGSPSTAASPGRSAARCA